MVRRDVPRHAIHNPFCWPGLLMIIVASCTLILGLRLRVEEWAFLGSNFLLVGLLATGGAAIFPVMLHSTLAPENSLTAYAVAAGTNSLLLASIWWPVGFALDRLFPLHLTTLCGESQRQAGHLRFHWCPFVVQLFQEWLGNGLAKRRNTDAQGLPLSTHAEGEIDTESSASLVLLVGFSEL
jgi:hypothetical protein